MEIFQSDLAVSAAVFAVTSPFYGAVKGEFDLPALEHRNRSGGVIMRKKGGDDLVHFQHVFRIFDKDHLKQSVVKNNFIFAELNNAGDGVAV